MKLNFLLYFLLFSISLGCSQSRNKKAVDKSEILRKYSFKPLSNTVLPEELKDELYVPFYKDGKYYFSDYEGKIISKVGWEEIKFTGNNDFFWGRLGSTFSLYRYPEHLLVDRKFTKKELDKVHFELELESPNGNLYSLGVYKKIDLSKTTSIDVEGAEVTAVQFEEKKIRVKEKYYFSRHSSQTIIKSYLDHTNFQLRESPQFRPSKFGRNYSLPYRKALTEDYQYCMIDINGERALQENFWDVKPITKTLIAVQNQAGKMALANVTTNKIFNYKFDEIRQAPECLNTAYGWIDDSEGKRQFYQLDENGLETPIQNLRKIKCSDTTSILPPVRKKRKQKRMLIFKEDNKFGVKDSTGKEVLAPVFFKRPRVLEDLGWICIKEASEFGIMDFDGNWIFPLEKRKVFYAGGSGPKKYSFELQDNGYRCIFNEKFELFLERPPVFLDIDKYDWQAIQEDIRPPVEQLSRPLLFQEYYVLSDKSYGHVFTAKGKYISSHKGKYDENVSFVGIPRPQEFGGDFVPIGLFEDEGIKYYVRLTDGFEYRSK